MGRVSRPHRDSIPDRPACSSVAIPTELPGPHHYDNGRANAPHCYVVRTLPVWPHVLISLLQTFKIHITFPYLVCILFKNHFNIIFL